MSRNLLIAALALESASLSAQVVNTQVNGLTLTNGLSSITDSSGFGSDVNLNTGIGYLTDNDTSTYVFNLGMNLPSTSALQGNFGGTISSSATGIYIVSVAIVADNTILPFGPSISIQLLLNQEEILTNTRTYGLSDFTINYTQDTGVESVYYQGLIVTSNESLNYAYMTIPFSDFSVTPDQVLGIRLSNFTAQYPDISFIGVGYAGAPIPEPSTYGLILGGLALAGAAIRRRKSAK